jgi:hypothetical protein
MMALGDNNLAALKKLLSETGKTILAILMHALMLTVLEQ